MDTRYFAFFNETGIVYEIRNYCGRNIGTDDNSNFTLCMEFLPYINFIYFSVVLHTNRLPLRK